MPLSVRGALVLFSCLALVGCGGGNGEGGGDGGAPDAAGAPVGRQPQGEAIASPLKIPEWSERGLPLTDARWQRLEAKFARACGGELCVDLRLRPQPPETPRQYCKWTLFEPAEGDTVERGGTVWVVCEAMTDEERGGDSSGGEENGSSDDGGGTDTGGDSSGGSGGDETAGGAES